MTTAQAGGSAKDEWDRLSEHVAQTQAIVGGSWEPVDSSARACGDGGAQWAITRLGRGTSLTERPALVEQIEREWKKYGWELNRTAIGGDAPGVRLRFPAGGSDERRFFIDIGFTVHGTTIEAQTPCAPGNVDQLNAEQYAYKHSPGIDTTPTPTN
ncbi:hypothetical protein [Curtobacterium sp. ISL-83]|uniref:hypothetical protein n=1 Tax=Curtobacterium sp. ISL-83 TaxID=2819145 RepID=UPI001BEBB5AD|nr:hypothetical protein [Curtobacterium sp. ISL-83]MBT2503126.1 hypothetical protein [Curtobacterium sp. ISL-83]